MTRLLLTALLLLLAGCGAPAASTPATDGPVVTVLEVSRSGGLCAQGACAHPHLVVRSDGSWTVTVPSGQDGAEPTTTEGTLTAAQRDALDEGRRETTLADHERPERSCASWVDGFDVEVRWRAESGEPHEVSSCDHVLSARDPLLGLAKQLTTTAG
ncbi:hypothetical protein [Nocardioides marmoribigeumensis]|uniref:Lipoprotein n=1 Tax=Nocardioides marmoribigeumensis TaxID=433649 RepID=A0ABU2BQJ2_9ACTN|nr:hypothetical protein [Nocardioides marmoribigeumensis]MDR7360910.1 hypothetical protein [Nocardioides marmoribigeumensis]